MVEKIPPPPYHEEIGFNQKNTCVSSRLHEAEEHILRRATEIKEIERKKAIEESLFSDYERFNDKNCAVELIEKIKIKLNGDVNFCRSDGKSLLEYSLISISPLLVLQLLKDPQIKISKKIIDDNIFKDNSYAYLLINHQNAPVFSKENLVSFLTTECKFKAREKVIKALLEKGADPFLDTGDYDTPCYVCAKESALRCIAEYVSLHPEICDPVTLNNGYRNLDKIVKLVADFIEKRRSLVVVNSDPPSYDSKPEQNPDTKTNENHDSKSEKNLPEPADSVTTQLYVKNREKTPKRSFFTFLRKLFRKSAKERIVNA